MADAQRLVTTLRHRLGDGPEHVVVWDTVEITVGRHPGQDLVVPDGDVSREHTVFRCERSSFVVEDRGTALGTRVNGARVRSAALDPGDVVEVGRLRIEFHQSQQMPRVGGCVRYASELKADAVAIRGPGDRTMLGLELDDALASPAPAADAPHAAGARALSDDGALEEVPEIGDDLALPAAELEEWCAGGKPARDLDLELGLGAADATADEEDDPGAKTLRDASALAATAAEPAPAACAAAAETAVELALELRGSEASVRGLLALLEAGELPLGPLRVRLRGAARRLGAVSLLALGLGAGLARAEAATLALAPEAYATERGADGGEPVAQLADLDQAGADDDPARYVRFMTPDAAYRGVRSYRLPDEVATTSLEGLAVRANLRGPARKTQAWKWKLYDWRRRKWVKLGDNKLATAGVWSGLEFAAPGDAARYVDPTTREIRVLTKSSNDRADASLDAESVVLAVREPPTLGACPLLPADNVWNARVDALPLDPHSDDYVASLGANAGVHPDFGAGLWEGAPIGIPWASVGAGQPTVDVGFYYPDESDPGPYPIPPDAPIEGGPRSDGDRHILVVDHDACLLYELFDAQPKRDGSVDAGSGAVFDLTSNALRPAGWTSADAAGFPILPGLVRYEEVAAGEIRHALRFTAADIRHAYVWPARHRATCGGHGDDDLSVPPMGQRFRLKAAFDVSGYSPQVQVILVALQRYGMLLADCGSSWYLSGAPDPGFDDDALVSELRTVPGSAFEAVDVSGLMASPDSGQVLAP